MKRLCGLALLVLLAGCAEGSKPARPQQAEAPANVRDPAATAEPGNSLIAFESGNGIEIISADGSGRTPIPGTAGGQMPQWSPDGSRLVFVCYFGDAGEIQELCIINRDGTDLRRLTETAEPEFSPDWSPSGRWIAFSRDNRIFVMRPDGGDQRVVPNTKNSSELGWRYSKRIVFIRGSTDGGDIYTIRRDGTGRRRLTFPHIGYEESPQWSPDGNWIVFVRLTDVATFDIFKMKRDGSRVRRLTKRCCSPWVPTWSPNGRAILFLYSGLHKMKPDGSEVRMIPGTKDAGPADWTAN